MLTPKLLLQIEKVAYESDTILDSHAHKQLNEIGSRLFSLLYIAMQQEQSLTKGRYMLLDSGLTRLMTVGFDSDKKVCFLGMPKELLARLGISTCGVAWVVKDHKPQGGLCIAFALKRGKIGELGLSNIRLAVAIDDLVLAETVADCDKLCFCETYIKAGFNHISAYSPAFDFLYVDHKKTNNGYKTPNF